MNREKLSQTSEPRLSGVVAWVIAAATYFALMSRLVNRIH
jgi:hypothetical protein